VCIYDTPSANIIEESIINTDTNVLTYFNKMFNPFYNLLLNEMNNIYIYIFKLRNQARNNGSNGTHTGRPVHEGQSTTYSHTHYNNSFSTPFTIDNLNCFLACFYQMCIINVHNSDIYWCNGNAQKMGYSYWFSIRMSQYMFEEMLHCINPNIDVWIEPMFSEQGFNI
jgi:hypothetical protein